jgi:TP901 family phage tail tape measure protein
MAREMNVYTKYIVDTDGAIREVNHFDKRVGRSGQSFAKIARGMTMAAMAIAGGLTAAVKAASDFEYAMANVDAVARTTTKEFAQLEAVAKKIGTTTPHSAKEAADGMYYLASAGQSATEILKTFPPVAQLATATQHELAATTDIVVGTLNSFRLSAEQTTRVTNVLASATQISQATMTKLGESMKYVGPVARSVGMSIEETVATLAQLYQVGLQGSDAGTALKNVLMKLLKPTEEFEKWINKARISVEDVNPTLHSLADIFDLLKEKGFGVQEAIEGFGLRGVTAASFLSAVGGKAIQDFTDKITGTTAAADMAARQSESFHVQVAILKNQIVALGIELGTIVLPILKSWRDKVEGVVTWIRNLTRQQKEFAVKTAAATAALLFLIPKIYALGTALNLGLGPIGLIVIAITGLIFAYNAAGKAIDEYGDALKRGDEATAESLKLKAQVAAMFKTLVGPGAFMAHVETLAGTIELMVGMIALGFETMVGIAKDGWNLVLNPSRWSELLDPATFFTSHVDAWKEGFALLWEEGQKGFGDVTAFGDRLDAILNPKKTGKDIGEDLGEGLAGGIEEFKPEHVLRGIIDGFEKVKGVVDSVKDKASELTAPLLSVAETFSHVVGQIGVDAAAHAMNGLAIVESYTDAVLEGSLAFGEAMLKSSLEFLKQTTKQAISSALGTLLANQITAVTSAIMAGTFNWAALAQIPLIMGAYGAAVTALNSIDIAKLHEGGQWPGTAERLALIQGGEVTLDRSLTTELGQFLQATRAGSTYRTTMHNTFNISQDVDVGLVERKLARLQRNRWSRKG